MAGRHAMMAEDTAAAAAAATASSSSSSSSGRKSSGGAAASKVDLDVLLGVRERVCPRDVFAWLIAPELLETFFSERWEKRSAVIRRNEPGRYSKLFSSEVLDTILREVGRVVVHFPSPLRVCCIDSLPSPHLCRTTSSLE